MRARHILSECDRTDDPQRAGYVGFRRLDRRQPVRGPEFSGLVAPGIAGDRRGMAAAKPTRELPVRALGGDGVVLLSGVQQGRDLLGNDDFQAVFAQGGVFFGGAAVGEGAELGELIDAIPDDQIVRVSLIDRTFRVDRLDVTRQRKAGQVDFGADTVQDEGAGFVLVDQIAGVAGHGFDDLVWGFAQHDLELRDRHAEVGHRRPCRDPVRPAQRLGHAEGVHAVDHATAQGRVVHQIGGTVHEVAGDASAADGNLAIVGVDRDGAAVDPAGDDQIAADINQARLPWAGAGEGVAVEELGAGGDGPVVGHRFAGFGDGDGLPAAEAGGADLDGYEVGGTSVTHWHRSSPSSIIDRLPRSLFSAP